MDTIRSTGRRFNCRVFLKKLCYGFVTEYETPKIVMVHSYTVTILQRFMQSILLLYSIFYLLIYDKGYQKQDTSIISSVTLKVKGIGFIRTPNNYSYIVDGTDYIIPPSENNAIFIMTNFIETDQSRSTCMESKAVKQAKCQTDEDCQSQPSLAIVNGRWTGRCSLSPTGTNTTEESTGLCEIEGWCPVEDDLRASTVIREILNFTIFIKNFIEFPTFNIKHKNMVENLKPCVFDPIKHQDCPIFRLDYIMNKAAKDAQERESMLLQGGVIRVKIDWNCNLDRNIQSCRPIYSFARLDIPSLEETFSIGFNFRFASHWKHQQTYLRSLRKAFGLRFIISVSGKAGKFDFITLTLNTGSLVGIFGLATFVCDYILLNLTRRASLYREQVIERIAITEELEKDILQNMKKQKEKPTIVFENPTYIDTQMTGSPRSYKSNERFPIQMNSKHSLGFISETQLRGSPTKIGVTNSIK